jgi:hypothetical protein
MFTSVDYPNCPMAKAICFERGKVSTVLDMVEERTDPRRPEAASIGARWRARRREISS